jgi:YidC/Oxa1 family membrane protein insertase
MDRKTVIAVALCVLILIAYPFILKMFGLDRYLRPAVPPPVATVDTTRSRTGAARTDTLPAPGGAMTPAPAPSGREGAPVLSSLPLKPVQAEIERSLAIETPLYRAEFSNRGARLLGVQLKHYASAHGAHSHDGKALRPRPGQPVPPEDRVILNGEPLFALDLGSDASRMPLDALVYSVAESLDAAGETRVLTFTARDTSGFFIRQTWRVRPESYALDLEVEVRGVPNRLRLADYSLTLRSWPLVAEADPVADTRGLKVSGLVGSSLHKDAAAGLRKGAKRFEGNAVLAAVQTRYFMSAVVATQASPRATIAASEARRLTPEQRAVQPPNAPEFQDVAIGTLVASLPGETNPVNRYVVYCGPNSYFLVAKLGIQLERVIDLGWSWIRPFSILLLRLMVWLHTLVPNYGFTIILLATLVRLLLHPLNMMSIKSMRAMQRLQPEMERLKEKYKNDAQALNTAVMALYRENKVNPAGGCLPMLLQMPLFFALYSVLWNAIELRQAPFVFWIHDLSAPDKLFEVAGFPIRLLPLLMAGSGFLTQKLTPTDPRQASTMYMMNAVMVVFFYGLPSGLVLYWTVMNLLTALQQWLVLREDGGPLMPTGALVTSAPEGGTRQKVASRAGSK